MTNTKHRIDTLKKKRDQFAAQIQALEAAERAREHKKDTRRKILIGAYMLEKGKESGILDKVLVELDDYLVRNPDRALFDLPPKEKAEA